MTTDTQLTIDGAELDEQNLKVEYTVAPRVGSD